MGKGNIMNILKIIAVGLILVSCNHATYSANHNPKALLAPATFEQDFVFNPAQEQQFDFYVSRRERGKNFAINMEFWVPIETGNEELEQKIKRYLFNLDDKWAHERSNPRFDMVLEHHLESGEILNVPLGGSSYQNGKKIGNLIDKPPVRSHMSLEYISTKKDGYGKKYAVWIFLLSGFVLEERKGLYRFKIKPVDQLKLDFNEIKPKIAVNRPVFHK